MNSGTDCRIKDRTWSKATTTPTPRQPHYWLQRVVAELATSGEGFLLRQVQVDEISAEGTSANVAYRRLTTV